MQIEEILNSLGFSLFIFGGIMMMVYQFKWTNALKIIKSKSLDNYHKLKSMRLVFAFSNEFPELRSLAKKRTISIFISLIGFIVALIGIIVSASREL